MILLDALFFQTPFGITLIGIWGLMVGSFLNVVIYRLPVMMKREERIYAWEILYGEKEDEDNNPYKITEAFNLMFPGSHCPNCGAHIHFWQNIPVISYLLQRGRCTNCGIKISVRYLLVELLCGALSILVVLRYPEPWQLLFALLLTWGLLAMIFIDAEQQLLPDAITLPFMWLGIIAAYIGNGLFVSLETSVMGAIVGYLSLWSVYWVFRLIIGKEGMGYGDFKLLALLLAWQGFTLLPFILFFSSIMGLLFAGIRRIGYGVPMAYGPYLAIAGWLTFMYGGQIAVMTGLTF